MVRAAVFRRSGCRRLRRSSARMMKLPPTISTISRALPGVAIAGIPRCGQARPLATYIDADLLAYDAVWAAAGTPQAVFRVEPAKLRDAAGAIVIDVK